MIIKHILNQFVYPDVLTRNKNISFDFGETALQQHFRFPAFRAATALPASYTTIVILDPPYVAAVLKDRAGAAQSLGDLFWRKVTFRRFRWRLSERVDLRLFSIKCLFQHLAVVGICTILRGCALHDVLLVRNC